MKVSTRFCSLLHNKGTAVETKGSVALRLFALIIGCGGVGVGVASLYVPALTLPRRAAIAVAASGGVLVCAAILIKRVRESIDDSESSQSGEALRVSDLEYFSEERPMSDEDILRKAKQRNREGGYREGLLLLQDVSPEGRTQAVDKLEDTLIKNLVRQRDKQSMTISREGFSTRIEDKIFAYLESNGKTPYYTASASKICWKERRGVFRQKI